MLQLHVENIDGQCAHLKIAVVQLCNMPFKVTIVVVEDDVWEQSGRWEQHTKEYL